MTLAKYKEKRNFKETPEPKGKEKSPEKKLAFVIQRHKASHLHYDFRLEMEGVLKSWAVPKGPSLNPEDKRLAMMVEDHPYDYKDFAGIIPEGNYGAGIVEIWDEGYYTDIEGSSKKGAEKKLLAGLKAGSIKFRLYGNKLNGEFALVKIKNSADNSWLLIKHNDEYAIHKQYSSEDDTPRDSPINKWLAEHKTGKKKRSAKAVNESTAEVSSFRHTRALPGETKKLRDFITPMLAKDTDRPFDDPDWIFEIKWDGYRAIAEVNKNDVSLYSRNGNTFNASYPLVVDALKKQHINAVLDGEVVVFDDEGNPSFNAIQNYNGENPICYYVFDMLEINGEDLTDLPLLERKERLREIITDTDIIKYSDHIEEKGNALFDLVGQKDMEGIIAKLADSRYLPGVRTSNWLKIKHHKTMEAIICGYTKPSGSRKYFGALVLGVYRDKKLKYIGHTGSGFNMKSIKEMYEVLQPLVTSASPFNERVKTNMPVTWVEPKLVCEIKYSEITPEGNLRHPIFLHLREDKKETEVTMDSALPVSKDEAEEAAGTEKPSKKGKSSKQKKAGETADPSNEKERILAFGKTKVKISNPNKIFWPDMGITKGDVVDYYQKMADYILPYLKDRPESLYRSPNGIEEDGFFQKDAGGDAPDWVKSHKIFSESNQKDIDYIICNDAATLAYLNNLGCIELNPWHSTYKDQEYPDYLIIDIDPSDNNTFDQVIETALVVHEVLEKAGAANFCKTSGATGLHVYVPCGKKYTYDQIKDFAHLVCLITNEQLPGFTSLDRNLKKRGKNHIYLDHLQNRKGQTIACAYSLRPKKGAAVSTPLLWEEVKTGLHPWQFNIKTVPLRVEKMGDIFKGILGKGIDMEKCLENLNK